MMRNSDGFTLIELMIVVTVIGILAAIALPNFASMSENAREAAVKSNMHTIQLATEDYAARSGGIYPVAADQAAVLAMLPMGQYPVNPFTNARDAWLYAAPAAPGIIGYTTATVSNYALEGYGKDALLPLVLHN